MYAWTTFLREGMNMPTAPASLFDTPYLRKAREELAKLEAVPEMRELYYARMKQAQIDATPLEEHYLKGEAKGKPEGKRDAILTLLQMRSAEWADAFKPALAQVNE
jgi:hypothetical protein